LKHTLSILVENRFGELSRIVGLFSARGFNIESLTVAEGSDPEVSRVTLVTTGSDHTIEQIARQLDKQVRVLKVEEVNARAHVEREMILVKLAPSSAADRQAALSMALLFGARAVEVSSDGLIIEATGDWEQVNALGEALKPLGLVELVRSGRVAMTKLGRGTEEPAHPGVAAHST
jgi:acetolactate synthase-1/3 small subunit